MQTALINPNQFRHFGVVVQNDLTLNILMHLRNKDTSFRLPIDMQGTIVGFTSHILSEDVIEHCTHNHITSPKPWEPNTVTFEKTDGTLESVIQQVEDLRGVKSLSRSTPYSYYEEEDFVDHDDKDMILNID